MIIAFSFLFMIVVNATSIVDPRSCEEKLASNIQYSRDNLNRCENDLNTCTKKLAIFERAVTCLIYLDYIHTELDNLSSKCLVAIEPFDQTFCKIYADLLNNEIKQRKQDCKETITTASKLVDYEKDGKKFHSLFE